MCDRNENCVGRMGIGVIVLMHVSDLRHNRFCQICLAFFLFSVHYSSAEMGGNGS